MIETTRALLGLDVDTKDLSVLQMSLRAVVIFVTTIVTVRVGQKRFFGRNTAVDFILAIVLGSVASRAINGSAPFVPTIVAGFVLIGVHWLLTYIAFHWRTFGKLVKGRASLLVRDGELQTSELRRLLITHDDLLENLRLNGSNFDLTGVKEAHLERNGQLSVVQAGSAPRVLEVRVEDGVQTVRIELT